MTRWFRMYDELVDDPKVQTLPAEDFRAWVNLLALASKNGGTLPSFEDIAFRLRRSLNDVETLIERLLNATLIDRRNGGANGVHYAPHGWDKRQYKSDTSTERVKRFRNAKRDVSETPSEPETESDTEQTPLPPADGGLGSGQKIPRLASALCRIAGIDKCGQAATAHVRRWVEDGIAEATMVETARGVVAHLRAPARSLKVFDAPIRRAHEEALRKRPPPRANGGPPAKPAEPEPPAADQEEVRALVGGLARSLRAREQLPLAAGGAH